MDIIADPTATTILLSLSSFRSFVDKRRLCVFSIIGTSRSTTADPLLRRLLDGRCVIEPTFTDPYSLAYTYCRESINMHTRVTGTMHRQKSARVEATREWHWSTNTCPLLATLLVSCTYRARIEFVRIIYAAGVTLETPAAFDALSVCLSHTTSVTKAHERARDIRAFLAKTIALSPAPAEYTCPDPTCALHSAAI